LVKAFKGGFSGGTLATMKLQLEEVRANKRAAGSSMTRTLLARTVRPSQK
jgi:hypothetical protein